MFLKHLISEEDLEIQETFRKFKRKGDHTPQGRIR